MATMLLLRAKFRKETAIPCLLESSSRFIEQKRFDGTINS